MRTSLHFPVLFLCFCLWLILRHSGSDVKMLPQFSSCEITLVSTVVLYGDDTTHITTQACSCQLLHFEPSWVHFFFFFFESVWVFCSNRPQGRQNGDSRSPLGMHAMCVDGCLLRSYWTGCLPSVLPSHSRCVQVSSKRTR